MRAVVLRESGPADNLKVEEVEAPAVIPGHALVQVAAVGVCYRDIVERRGGFAFAKRPVVPGHEIAGEIVELGPVPPDGYPPGTPPLQIGTRVVNLHRAPCGTCSMCKAGHEPRCETALYMFGLTADGGYAQFVLAPASCLVPVPSSVPLEQACFLGCTAAVALRALRTRANLSEGETVVITGASGGVGMHAIQIAKILGAHVIAVTSSEAKAAALRDLGADEVVVSSDYNFHKEVKRRTKIGAHVALDCVGTPTLNASARCLRPMGRVVVLGNVNTDRWAVNPGYVILSEITIVGSAGCSRADLTQVLQWVAEGRLKPVLEEVLPLSAAADAHRRLEAKGVTGRLVLDPSRA